MSAASYGFIECWKQPAAWAHKICQQFNELHMRGCPNLFNWFIETKELVWLIQALGWAANQRKWRSLAEPSSSSRVFIWGEWRWLCPWQFTILMITLIHNVFMKLDMCMLCYARVEWSHINGCQQRYLRETTEHPNLLLNTVNVLFEFCLGYGRSSVRAGTRSQVSEEGRAPQSAWELVDFLSITCCAIKGKKHDVKQLVRWSFEETWKQKILRFKSRMPSFSFCFSIFSFLSFFLFFSLYLTS